MSVRWLFIVLLIAIAAAAFAHDIEVGAEGQTIGWTSPLDPDKDITVALSTDAPFEVYELRYRHVASVTTPVLLTQRDTVVTPKVNGSAVFTIPRSPSGFTIYNLWRKTQTGSTAQEVADANAALAKIDIARLEQERDDTPAQKKIDALQAELDELNDAAADTPHKKEIARLAKQIADLEKELETYVKIPVGRSVDAVKDVQAKLRPLRARKAELEEEDAAENPRKKEIEKLIAALEKDPERVQAIKVLDEAKAEKDKQQAIVDRVDEYDVLKVGLIIAGDKKKSLYYNLIGESIEGTLTLQEIGDVPMLVDGDLIYLLVGRKHSAQVGSFTLTVAKEDGTTIDSNPVRPTTNVPDLEAVEPPGAEPETVARRTEPKFAVDDAFEDIVLPFVRPARGNNILKMTVKTQATVVSLEKTEIEDGGAPKFSQTKEKTTVELLKDAELPQVHPLYRFNVTTGLAYSGIRQPGYEKVRTVDDDKSTTDVDESRYRIDTLRGNRKVRPNLAVTIYWKGNDPLRRLTLADRLIPNPMVALGFEDPTDNIFAGFSNELWRGVQITWGIHRGKIDVPKTRVNETEEKDLPTTMRSEAKQKFFIGISFNLNFLTKLIKIPAAS